MKAIIFFLFVCLNILTTVVSLSTVTTEIATSIQLTSVCAAISTTISLGDTEATAIIDIQESDTDFIIGFSKYKVYSYISFGHTIDPTLFQFLSIGLEFFEGQTNLNNGSFLLIYEIVAPSLIGDLVESILSQFVIGKDLILISALPDTFTKAYCSKNGFECLPITLTQLATCGSSDDYIITPNIVSSSSSTNSISPNDSLPVSLLGGSSTISANLKKRKLPKLTGLVPVVTAALGPPVESAAESLIASEIANGITNIASSVGASVLPTVQTATVSGVFSSDESGRPSITPVISVPTSNVTFDKWKTSQRVYDLFV